MVIKHLKVNRLNETKVGLKQKKERGASDLTLSQDFLFKKKGKPEKIAMRNALVVANLHSSECITKR